MCMRLKRFHCTLLDRTLSGFLRKTSPNEGVYANLIQRTSTQSDQLQSPRCVKNCCAIEKHSCTFSAGLIKHGSNASLASNGTSQSEELYKHEIRKLQCEVDKYRSKVRKTFEEIVRKLTILIR